MLNIPTTPSNLEKKESHLMKVTQPIEVKTENKENSFLETLSKRLKGRTGLMEEMAKIFLDQAPVMKSILENSHRQGDYESIRFEAHKFKSTVNIIGLELLRDFASKTEELYYHGKPVECTKELLQEFANQIDLDSQKVKSAVEELSQSQVG